MVRRMAVVGASALGLGACGGGGDTQARGRTGADARPAPAAADRAPMPSATPGTIRGTIRSGATGGAAPALAGALVCATNTERPMPRPRCVTSAADGTYALAALPAGPWRLVAAAPGHLAAAWTPTALGASPLRHVDGDVDAPTDLTLAAGATRVVGTVVDLDGAPVAGAWIEVTSVERARAPDAAPFITSAGADGRFEAWVPPGRLTVRAGADGYAERWLDGSTSAALPPLPLWPEGRVAGVVRDPAGAPVEGALVSVTVRAGWPDAVTRSGANGTYELRGLPAGVYQPRASAPGLVGRAATTVLLTVGERAGELDVATATAGQLRGRAWIGAAGQAPCGDCTLMLTTAGGGYVEAVADDDGVVALEAVPVGTHGGYLASATQGGRTLDPIVVSTGTATSLDWTLPPAGVVVGSVVDKHGPRPLEIAAVHANAGDAAEAGLLVARTGVTSSGAFTLGALPAGRYQVLVGRGEALLGPPQTVEVVVGGTGPASLALVADVPSPTPSTEPELLVGCPRHPRSRGTVRDAAGAPVPGVLVWSGPAALDAGCGASGAVARTSATGAFELGAGDELVEAVLLGDATGRRARALTAGHDLALVEPAMLHGQVTRAGAPATACALTLAGVERRINVDVTCAADGSFHVRGLPPDEYAVLDGTPGRVLTTTTLAPGAAGKLSIELPPPP